MSDKIVCPSCEYEIEITEAISSQLRQKLKKQYEAEQRLLEKKFAEPLEKEVAQTRAEASEKAAAKAMSDVAVELKDLREQLGESREKLSKAQEFELQLRKEKQALEDAKREFDLKLNRQLDQEREKIRKLSKQEFIEEHLLKDAQKEKVINDLREQISELKRKSEVSSQQLQGEVLEEQLERILAVQFPYDEIQPVPKGVHGGDVLHHVNDAAGVRCGTILWESKRTKTWSDLWLPKLRDDQRAAKAEAAAIISIELPRDVKTFAFVDTVWVCNWNCALGLATALRNSLIEVSQAKRSIEGRQGKMDQIVSYVSGPEFRQRVEGIAEAFMTMRNDLEAEKRALQKHWAKREKQLDRAMTSASGLYGDLSGIVGASLPEVDAFALPDPEEVESQ